MISFEDMIDNPALKFTAEKLRVLQVNIGSLCNLSCTHCHINAGPGRKEIMTRETMTHILRILPNFETLDITGGAPEMNPDFRFLVDEVAKLKAHIIVRSNLVIMTQKGYEDIPAFLADRNIEIAASLPCYTEENCDSMRGKGTFNAAISVLKTLNALGYGHDEKHILDLVYNPNGDFLPPNQSGLEAEYKSRLMSEHGIAFTRLLGWDGKLYDCDFNQPLGLTIDGPENIRDLHEIHRRRIRFGNHCYACTAGSGSSCGGSTV